MKIIQQSKINPYDLNSVGKTLHRNGVKKITTLRGNDPYNAGAVNKTLSLNDSSKLDSYPK